MLFRSQSLIYANLGFTSYLSDNMFKDCIKLESLILPFISGVGATVFENCISLTLLDLGSDKNSSLGNIYNNIFNNTITNDINLILNQTEYNNASGNSWRGFNFKSITYPGM